MTCIFCGGSMTEGTTKDFTDLDTCMVIVKDVPCLKCDQCGEKVFVGHVVRALEKIIDSVRDSLMEVAIINYSDKAA